MILFNKGNFMKTSDFTNQEFIDIINIYSAPYKIKNGDFLEPIKILDITRNDNILIVKTSQAFKGKYIIKRIFKFSDDCETNSIRTQIIEHTLNGDVENNHYGDYFNPIFSMISQNREDKGLDWLSRFSMDDLYYFANKYICPCSRINIVANSYFHNHCKDILMKDKNGYIISATSFGDYGIHYAKHAHTLSKLNSSTVFEPEDLEFYKLMLSKLDEEEKLLYTNGFINAHIQAFVSRDGSKLNFEQELKNGRIIAQKLLDTICDEQQNLSKF